MYAKIFKRLLDFWLSLFALIILSPLLFMLSVTGAIAMRGNPFFVQERPGKSDKKTGLEHIFPLIKFRTMYNREDSKGKLLPDKERLNAYGSWLRSTSLDELPSLICITAGWLSFIGPRPFLVRDMVFMTDAVRRRHTVRPGLTGLAQVNGRNNITWEQKFEYDLQYIDEGITFTSDLRIALATVKKVLEKSGVARKGTVSDIDYGDWLLMNGKVTNEYYDSKQKEAKNLLGAHKINDKRNRMAAV